MPWYVPRSRGQGGAELILLATAICVWAMLELLVFWWVMTKNVGHAAQEAAKMAAEVTREKGVEVAEKYANAIT